ncbi:MAG: DUF2281 domain-containing protein [Cyanobacteria bacterium P01_A01_bin.123]
MSTADQIYELVKSLPQAQASEVLTFAEFLLAKHQSASQTANANTAQTWPELVQSLAGSWGSDFPSLEEIRANAGQDIPRERF